MKTPPTKTTTVTTESESINNKKRKKAVDEVDEEVDKTNNNNQDDSFSSSSSSKRSKTDGDDVSEAKTAVAKDTATASANSDIITKKNPKTYIAVRSGSVGVGTKCKTTTIILEEPIIFFGWNDFNKIFDVENNQQQQQQQENLSSSTSSSSDDNNHNETTTTTTTTTDYKIFDNLQDAYEYVSTTSSSGNFNDKQDNNENNMNNNNNKAANKGEDTKTNNDKNKNPAATTTSTTTTHPTTTIPIISPWGYPPPPPIPPHTTTTSSSFSPPFFGPTTYTPTKAVTTAFSSQQNYDTDTPTRRNKQEEGASALWHYYHHPYYYGSAVSSGSNENAAASNNNNNNNSQSSQPSTTTTVAAVAAAAGGGGGVGVAYPFYPPLPSSHNSFHNNNNYQQQQQQTNHQQSSQTEEEEQSTTLHDVADNDEKENNNNKKNDSNTTNDNNDREEDEAEGKEKEKENDDRDGIADEEEQQQQESNNRQSNENNNRMITAKKCCYPACYCKPLHETEISLLDQYFNVVTTTTTTTTTTSTEEEDNNNSTILLLCKRHWKQINDITESQFDEVVDSAYDSITPVSLAAAINRRKNVIKQQNRKLQNNNNNNGSSNNTATTAATTTTNLKILGAEVDNNDDDELLPFSVDEDRTILLAHTVIGNKWNDIARMLPGRDEDEIKSHWDSIMKPKIEKYLADRKGIDEQYVSYFCYLRNGRFDFSGEDLDVVLMSGIRGGDTIITPTTSSPPINIAATTGSVEYNNDNVNDNADDHDDDDEDEASNNYDETSVVNGGKGSIEIKGNGRLPADKYLGLSQIMSPQKKLKRNGPVWTLREDHKLVRIVRMMGKYSWSRIARELGTDKSQDECKERWKNHLLPNISNYTTGSAGDIAFATAALTADKPPSSSAHKTGQQLQARTKRRSTWTEKEDQQLLEFVQKNGASKWVKVAAALGSGRTGKQVRERWHNHLNPDITKAREWSLEEDRMILHIYITMGTKWSVMVTKLEEISFRRSDNAIKNHFSTMRKRISKYLVQKQQVNDATKIRYTKDGRIDMKLEEIDEILAFVRKGMDNETTTSTSMEHATGSFDDDGDTASRASNCQEKQATVGKKTTKQKGGKKSHSNSNGNTHRAAAATKPKQQKGKRKFWL